MPRTIIPKLKPSKSPGPSHPVCALPGARPARPPGWNASAAKAPAPEASPMPPPKRRLMPSPCSMGSLGSSTGWGLWFWRWKVSSRFYFFTFFLVRKDWQSKTKSRFWRLCAWKLNMDGFRYSLGCGYGLARGTALGEVRPEELIEWPSNHGRCMGEANRRTTSLLAPWQAAVAAPKCGMFFLGQQLDAAM